MAYATTETPLWMMARSILRDRERAFGRCLRMVRTTGDRDSFHDLRVATRRLREALRAVAPCFHPEEIDRIRRETGRLVSFLGSVRNLDEAIHFLSSSRNSSPAGAETLLEEWIGSLARERDEEAQQITNWLSRRKKRIPRLVDRLLANPRLFDSTVDPFRPFGAHLRDQIVDRGEKLIRHASFPFETDDFRRLHRLRITLKKFRYLFELSPPGESMEELLRTMRQYQDLLGELNDVEVFGEMFRDAFPSSDLLPWVGGLLSERRKALMGELLSLSKRVPLPEIARRAAQVVG